MEGKSQAQAIEKATLFMRKHGFEHVVDMDLFKCFNRLDRKFMMTELGRTVSDRSVLNLIRTFLKSVVMEDGHFTNTSEGSPQDGVISPLLSDIYLNVIDQKMKRRGIRIVRFADDILIFARTKADAGN